MWFVNLVVVVADFALLGHKGIFRYTSYDC